MAIGAVDADTDGDDDVFVKVGDHLYHGASQAVVGIFVWHDGNVTRVSLDGDPLVIRVGGVTQWGEGAHCDDVDSDGDLELLIHRVETRDHQFETWTWRERVLDWEGAEVRLVDHREGAIYPNSYTDPELRFYYQLECGRFDPPYPY
jgi:hypothetical protein